MNGHLTCALFHVVQFYHELKDELKDISPLPKFLVVKTIIFLSFWCVHHPLPEIFLLA
jgi:hypothetical protein